MRMKTSDAFDTEPHQYATAAPSVLVHVLKMMGIGTALGLVLLAGIERAWADAQPKKPLGAPREKP